MLILQYSQNSFLKNKTVIYRLINGLNNILLFKDILLANFTILNWQLSCQYYTVKKTH